MKTFQKTLCDVYLWIYFYVRFNLFLVLSLYKQ